MKRSFLVVIFLFALTSRSFSVFKYNERSIYSVISSTAYTTQIPGLNIGTEGLSFGLSDSTQVNTWGFLGYGEEQDLSIGIGLGFKHSIIKELGNSPAISFDMNLHTIINPDQTALLPSLLQPYNIGVFNNAYSFGLSLSKKIDDRMILHSAIKFYDYNIPNNIKYDGHLISFSIENRLNDWVIDFTEINYDLVNSVLNFGVKIDTAPTDIIRFSIGYMAGVKQDNGLSASQFIIGSALHF